MKPDYRPGKECRVCHDTLTHENTYVSKHGICKSCANKQAIARIKKANFINKLERIAERDEFVPLFSNKRETKTCASHVFLNPDVTRVACLDIEATGLRGDFGCVLCCVIKTYGKDEREIFRVDFNYPDLLSSEKEMLIDVRDCLQEYDGIAGYFSSRYDVQMLRTRMMYHGIQPNIPKMKHLDAYFVIRRNINTSSRRMERIGDILREHSMPELPEKTHLDPSVWIRAMHGRDPSAMEYIITHCVADVDLLEGILDYVKEQGWVSDKIIRM